MRVDSERQLDDATRAQVTALAERVEGHDDRSALSEQSLLHLRHARTPGVRHLLVRGEGGDPAGYAQLDERPGVEPSAELLVDPSQRRRGIGGALLDATLAERDDVRLWAHGMLPGAAALSASRGLEPVRELLLLRRDLSPGDEFPLALPAGYAVATYSPSDVEEIVAVNAAAFAEHAEQGGMTASDLLERVGEPWFDPAGFFLIRDERGALAAFHWTKVEGGVGEVYVVGVDPAAQGKGLGRAATAIGLAHLRDQGLPSVHLYVDGHNAPAVRTYLAQGFAEVDRDVQLARRVPR